MAAFFLSRARVHRFGDADESENLLIFAVNDRRGPSAHSCAQHMAFSFFPSSLSCLNIKCAFFFISHTKQCEGTNNDPSSMRSARRRGLFRLQLLQTMIDQTKRLVDQHRQPARRRGDFALTEIVAPAVLETHLNRAELREIENGFVRRQRIVGELRENRRIEDRVNRLAALQMIDR